MTERSLELSDEELQLVSTSQLIETTFKIYGTLFTCCFVAFLVLRTKFPITFTFNSVMKDHITSLSENRHGFISWTWKIFRHKDEEIFEHCGMSAVVYLRFLRLGLKLSAVGIFNSIFLIPVSVYGCTDETDACSSLEDALNKASVGNISAGNPGLVATAVGAYFIFGSAIYYIFHEFEWFTEHRHKFLSQPRPDNYTVYVAHIPKEYRSDVALLEYFRSVFSHDDVLEANIALDTYNLDKKVAMRKNVVEKLEHALTFEQVKGYRPFHMTTLGQTLDSIEAFEKELEKLNLEISSVINQIEEAKSIETRKFIRDMVVANGFNISDSDMSATNTSFQSFGGGGFYSDMSKGSRRLVVNFDSSEDEDEGGEEEADKLAERLLGTKSGSSRTGLLDTVLSQDDDSEAEAVVSSPALSNLPEHPHTPEFTHRPSLTCDTIETCTLGINGVSPFVQSTRVELTFEESCEKKRSTQKIHRKNKTLDSLSAVSMKSFGSAKQSWQKVGKTVTNVGKNFGNVGKYVGNAGMNIGKTIGNHGYKQAKKQLVTVKDLAMNSAQIATRAGSRMTRLLLGSEDGEVLDAGFVTFSNLTTKNQCVQIIHHSKPFTFHVKDAPLPKDIVWENVGVPHDEKNISFLLAQAATVGLCLVWTFPVAFFTSLSEAESISSVLPGLKLNETAVAILGQLSPVLLVSLTAILPVVLSVICRYEGHIAQTDETASLLSKLASFMIIQVFFVQAISGSIFQELGQMIDDPKQIINLLATTVPTQVKSFIQFILVNMFIGCSIELLRVVRVGMAVARSRVGPNLSNKERNRSYGPFKPISEPDEMEYPIVFAELALYFMVNLIYSCVAPIMSYFSLLTFGILSLVYRHQFIYVYSPKNDSGGKLWSRMIMLLVVCLIISEVTLIGIISIKRSVLAASLLAPLLVCTILFSAYIHLEHFRVTQFLPSILCKDEDIKLDQTLDKSFLKDQYLQPSLKEKIVLPEDISSEFDKSSFHLLSVAEEFTDIEQARLEKGQGHFDEGGAQNTPEKSNVSSGQNTQPITQNAMPSIIDISGEEDNSFVTKDEGSTGDRLQDTQPITEDAMSGEVDKSFVTKDDGSTDDRLSLSKNIDGRINGETIESHSEQKKDSRDQYILPLVEEDIPGGFNRARSFSC